MKLREDYTLSIRGLLNSPLESLLLVIGLALSIGATAAGLGMLEQSRQDGNALLEQAQYREIVVSAQTNGDNMDASAQLQVEGDTIRLSVSDLDAADISPDITHSYLSSRTRLRLNTENGGFGGFGPPTTEETESETSAGETVLAANAATDMITPAVETNTDNSENTENVRPPMDFEMAEVEGPQPVLDELSGYEVSDEFFDAMNLMIAGGSTFTAQDMANTANVLVLGSDIADTLFEDGEALGRQVASFNRIYTIIGVLEETGNSYDGSVFLPTSLLADNAAGEARRGPGGFNSTLHFTVDNANQLLAASEQLSSWFDSQYGEDALTITVPREEAERAIERTAQMAIITLVLALAGLLIASVNVSNILYGRTLRRRKQIGILKALGASQKNIFTLFFAEGGAILALGVLLGIGVIALFSFVLTQNASEGLATIAVILGMLLSSVITLFFTAVPALQATQVEPANAMRTE